MEAGHVPSASVPIAMPCPMFAIVYSSTGVVDPAL
jgi:hypothetical protein